MDSLDALRKKILPFYQKLEHEKQLQAYYQKHAPADQDMVDESCDAQSVYSQAPQPQPQQFTFSGPQ